MFGGHGLIMIVGAQAGARMSHRIQPRRIVLVGSAGLVVSSAALVISVLALPQAGFAGFLVPLLFFTAFLGLTQPALQAAALGPHTLRAGTAASLLGASNMVFAAVLSPVPGLFGVDSPVPTVVIMLCCEMAALAIFVVTVRRTNTVEV